MLIIYYLLSGKLISGNGEVDYDYDGDDIFYDGYDDNDQQSKGNEQRPASMRIHDDDDDDYDDDDYYDDDYDDDDYDDDKDSDNDMFARSRKDLRGQIVRRRQFQTEPVKISRFKSDAPE